MTEVTGEEVQLTKHNVKRIAHRATKHQRISDDAILRVIHEEENRMEEIFSAAESIAEHAGRHGIKEEDIMMVYKIRGEL